MGAAWVGMQSVQCSWSGLPSELKVHCLRPLPAEAALAFAATGRDARATAHSEDLWADLFHRDWHWVCPGGPPCGISFRQHHVSVTERARKDHSAFVVVGGTVWRDGRGHADASVLSSLSARDGELHWRSFVLPVPGRCAAGLCHGRWGQLYSVGGFDFSAECAMACAEALDVSALLRGEPRVQALPRMRCARACPGVVATPEAVLAIGGGSSMFTAAEANASVEALPHPTSSSSEWRPVMPLMRPRCAAGVCATASSQVFVVSGYAGFDRYEDTVEWADAAGSEGLLRGWKPGPALAHARAGCVACFGPEGCVWALGGGRNESESLASVERLDPRMPRWLGDVPPMPGRRRCFAGGFGIDGKLYIYGGWDSTRWHDPTAARLDLRAMRWETLPSFYGEVNGIIPYHFVSGCVAF
mmetsp:Transcript_157693/g.278348  ORF Transcript_157693/g.278348 Transcript_157693/m.278348 type:complete len:415 (+) Transcript_157693:36-1280(+)